MHTVHRSRGCGAPTRPSTISARPIGVATSRRGSSRSSLPRRSARHFAHSASQGMRMKLHRWLVVVALVAGVSIVCLQEEVGMTPHPTPAAGHLPDEGGFPSLAGAIEWINSPPLTPAGLRGKVVLVDVWTLTCINWLRTEPYIRAWAARYKDKGLVVIGVHSPEFEFEKEVANVRRAVKQMRIDYPVAVDSNMAIWQAF